MGKFAPEFHDSWAECFERLPENIKPRVAKKIRRILEGLPGRHLRFGVDFFVEEVGQYRICYKSFNERNVRRFYFVGNHKEYEKWVGI
jgi:hypothetical protein